MGPTDAKKWSEDVQQSISRMFVNVESAVASLVSELNSQAVDRDTALKAAETRINELETELGRVTAAREKQVDELEKQLVELNTKLTAAIQSKQTSFWDFFS
jgi:TolA-binding protein